MIQNFSSRIGVCATVLTSPFYIPQAARSGFLFVLPDTAWRVASDLYIKETRRRKWPANKTNR
jgi:hypothetical protein